MAQMVACRAAVRRPRVRISARHPSGDPQPELAATKPPVKKHEPPFTLQTLSQRSALRHHNNSCI
jgi:hypothetical protein